MKTLWMALGLTVIVGGSFFIYWKTVGPGSVVAVPPPRPPSEKELAIALLAEWEGMDDATRQAKIPDMVKALHVDREPIKLDALLALDRVGAHAVSPLADALGESADVRYYAVWGLGRVGPEARTALPRLLSLLRDDPSGDVRRKSAWALARIKPPAEVAIPALVAAFADRDVDVRQAAAESIAFYGPAAVPALVEAANASDREKRRVAIVALGLVGPDAKDAVPLLGQVMRDENSGLQDEAAAALAKLGPDAVPLLVESLRTDDTGIVLPVLMTGIGSPWAMAALWRDPSIPRQRAITALGQSGARQALTDALNDPHADVRAKAAGFVGQLGYRDRRVFDRLGRLLRDPDGSVRQQAGTALLTFAEPRDALPPLKQAAQDGNLDIRLDAVAYLQYLGAPALDPLVEALRDKDEKVRKQAQAGLRGLAVDLDQLQAAVAPLLGDDKAAVRESVVVVLRRCGAPAMMALISALKDPDDGVRENVIAALQELKADEKVLKPALLEAVKDKNPLVRAGAINTLTRFGNDTVLPFARAGLKDDGAAVRLVSAAILARFDIDVAPDLIEALRDKEVAVWQQAWKSLVQLQADDKLLLPLLARALNDDNSDVRQGAVFALERFGANAVPYLVQALKSKDRNVQRAAADTIDTIGSPARKAMPALVEVVDKEDTHPEVRKFVVRAMLTINGQGEFRKEPAKAVPALLEMLRDRNPTTRWGICQTLAAIGPEAREAIPGLTGALKDESLSVRNAAEYAIQRIGAERKE